MAYVIQETGVFTLKVDWKAFILLLAQYICCDRQKPYLFSLVNDNMWPSDTLSHGQWNLAKHINLKSMACWGSYEWSHSFYGERVYRHTHTRPQSCAHGICQKRIASTDIASPTHLPIIRMLQRAQKCQSKPMCSSSPYSLRLVRVSRCCPTYSSSLNRCKISTLLSSWPTVGSVLYSGALSVHKYLAKPSSLSIATDMLV